MFQHWNVSLIEAPKQTLYSLLTSDMLDIAKTAVPQKLTQGNGHNHLQILSSLGLKLAKKKELKYFLLLQNSIETKKTENKLKWTHFPPFLF